MSNGEIEKTMKRAERRAQWQRMGQTLRDPWAWAFSVLVAADVAARLLIVMLAMAWFVAGGVALSWWILLPLFVWMVAPMGYIFQQAQDRKRLIRLEAVLDGDKDE